MQTYHVAVSGHRDVVVAGWAGRDLAEVAHHIEELAVLGVAPPSQTPLYYRVAADRLTQDKEVEVVGRQTSGEVEPVLVWTKEGLSVGIGSDHTDRAAEAYNIALSKQLCPKILGRSFWHFDDVSDHWDKLIIRSFCEVDGVKDLYQEGSLASLLRPEVLIQKYKDQGNEIHEGCVMFCGTVPTRNGIFRADALTVELYDPISGNLLQHRYSVRELPVIG